MGIIDVSARQEQMPVLHARYESGKDYKTPFFARLGYRNSALQSVLPVLVAIFDIRCRKKRFDQGNQSTSSEKYELENILLVESSGFPANEAQWIDIKDVYIFQIDSLSLQIVCCIKYTSTQYGLHTRDSMGIIVISSSSKDLMTKMTKHLFWASYLVLVSYYIVITDKYFSSFTFLFPRIVCVF